MPDPPENGKGSPMANVLPREKRLAVLAALVDGNSIRAAERMTGVHRDTIMRFGLTVGEGSDRLHNRRVRDLSCSMVDMDEQWGWVHTKGPRVKETDPAEWGEQWTWLAIDRSSGSVAPSPSPGPVTPPAAPAASVPVAAAADPSGQLDLLAWRPQSKPLPPVGTQLDLFGAPETD